MINKKLMFLAILLVSLLAISGVSASDVDSDAILNEDLVNDACSDLISSTDLQSIDTSKEKVLNDNFEEGKNTNEEISNSKSLNENSGNENNIISDELPLKEDSKVLTNYVYGSNDDEISVSFFDVGYRSQEIIEIFIYEHNRDILKIYVDNDSTPRKTVNLATYDKWDYISFSPIDLNLNFGNHRFKVSLYNNSGEHIVANEEISYHCLQMYLDYGENIFEDVNVTARLWDINNDEGTLTYSINNKQIASKNFIANNDMGNNYFTIPYSYLKVGENVISVKYDGPNYPTDEISEVITIYPRIYDLPIFMSTVEETDLDVEFPKSFTGTVNVYDSYYIYNYDTYSYDYVCNLIGSSNIINGVATIKLSNLKSGAHGLIVESKTNLGEIDKVIEFNVFNNDPNVKVEVTPLNILVGENVFITLNSPVSHTLYVYVDGKVEKMYNMSSYIKILSDLSIGKHIISVKFFDTYSNTFIINVNALKTFITSSNTNAVYDTTKSVSATLIDNLGNPIAGKTVTLVINKKTYTAKTNAYGKATFKISAKLLPKAYTATIKFAGDKTYAQFTKSIKVTIKKATPKLTAKAKTFRVKVKTKKYTITLKNNNGKVMKNTKVTLTVNKKTFSAKTNSKGVATFKITNLKKKGKFTAVVKYAGSKYYNKVTKKPKITIKA